MALDQDLVDLFACPKCHGQLGTREKPEGFTCPRCRLFYEVREGIPNFLIDEAKALSEVEKSA